MLTIRKLLFTTWVMSIFSAIFLLTVILPRKGFDFTDHGYYLYNAFILSSGKIPSYGYASIINSVFMLFKIHSYLFYEVIYFALIIAGTLFFWINIQSIKLSPTLPLVIIIALSSRITYIASYQNASELFLLFGLGFLFLGSDNKKTPIITNLALILSAVFLVLSALSNMSLLPGVLLTFIFAYLYLKQQRQKHLIYFYLPYIALSVVLIFLYIFSPLSLFKPINLDPYEHTTFIALLKKIPDLIKLIFKPSFVALCMLGILTRFTTHYFFKKKNLSFLYPAIFLFAFAILWVIQFHTMRHYGAEYKIILLTFFLFQAMLLSNVFLLQPQKKYLMLFIASVITSIYAFGLALTARSGFYFHLGLFPAISIAIISLFFQISTQEKTSLNKVLQTIYLLILLTLFASSLIFFMKYNYRSYPTFSHKLEITHGPLEGIYANKNKLKSIIQIQQLFNKYECNKKIFIAYPALPLLYYYFQTRALQDKAWISSQFQNMTNQQIISYLKNKKHWCVIIAPNFNGDPQQHASTLQLYLKNHSHHIHNIAISDKPSDPGFYPWKFVFYFK